MDSTIRNWIEIINAGNTVMLNDLPELTNHFPGLISLIPGLKQEI